MNRASSRVLAGVMASDAPLPAVARAVASTSGRAALRRAWPLAVGGLALGGVLFGPNGLAARDLTGPARHAPALRAALWGAWLLASRPFARALLGDPSIRFVVAQPVSRARLGAVLSAALAASQAPWAAFRARAEGTSDAAASLLAGVVGAWVLGAMPRGAAPKLASAALALALVATPDPRVVTLAALLAGVVVVPAALASLGHAPRRSLASTSLPRSPAMALAAVHARLLARTAIGALARHAALTIGAAMLAVPALRNRAAEPSSVKITLALTLLTAPLAALTHALATSFAARDESLRPRLAAEAVAPGMRAAVALAVVALPPAVLAGALVAGASLTAGSRATEVVSLGGAAFVWGAGLAGAALFASRRGDATRAAGLTALTAATAMGALLAAEARALMLAPAALTWALAGELWRARP
ncbi:MAG: hypothetical protein U0324_20680 [Polyangiales bacterium]